jgi:hypothetical protein
MVVLLVSVWSSGAAASVEEAVNAVAARLEQTQNKNGWTMGSWRAEELFTGSIASGMSCAYEYTGDPAFRLASRRAGYYILRISDFQGNLLGDEAYAFVRLEKAARLMGDPASVWQPALEEFYASTRRPGYEESTEAYLAYFEGGEPATTVFMLAHHVLAVYYVDDLDKELWRDALVYHLSQVDDNCSFPVMALGAATWALASIDGLDDTPVNSGDGSPYWDGFVLSDLPGLLRSHQVPAGELFGGTFYWRFDHTAGGSEGATAGYTEDAIYGALGLVAVASASENDARQEMEDSIAAVNGWLLQGVDGEGAVYEHLSQQGQTYHAFAGEMLQALYSIQQYWALNGEGGS